VAILWTMMLGTSFAGPAAPYRAVGVRPQKIEAVDERREDVLVLKLIEGTTIRFNEDGKLETAQFPELSALLYDAKPWINRPVQELRDARKRVNPSETLGDLSLYLQIRGPDAIRRGNALLKSPWIETAYLAPKPPPPPIDIDPITPDFSGEQHYIAPGPAGFGFDVTHRWPGASGTHTTIADIEYGYDPTHEDLGERAFMELGYPMNWYPFHGNGVLGILGAVDNGYGITGLVPDAALIVVSPFVDNEEYNVAESIVLATEHLDAGDVLLIEQQGWVDSIFLPVEIDPAVFDAITLAVAKGIVVIEPAGNGGDAPCPFRVFGVLGSLAALAAAREQVI